MNLNTRGHIRIFLSQGPFVKRTLQLSKTSSGRECDLKCVLCQKWPPAGPVTSLATGT